MLSAEPEMSSSDLAMCSATHQRTAHAMGGSTSESLTVYVDRPDGPVVAIVGAEPLAGRGEPDVDDMVL